MVAADGDLGGRTSPWRERDALAALAAAWRRLAGRTVVNAAAGPGWTGIELAGTPHLFLNLLARPGAVLVWDDAGPLAGPLREALGRIRKPPQAAHLRGCRLTGAGLLPADRILVLRFATPDGSDERILLHQLFGPRGNTALLDGSGRLLWLLHPSPHPALVRPMKAENAAPGPSAGPMAAEAQGTTEADGEAIRKRFRAAALARLRSQLTADLRGRLQRRLRRAVTAADRLVDNLGRDLAAAGEGRRHRRLAEALAANLTRVPRGAAEVSLPDPAGGGELRIPLDPTLSPAANLERLFQLARKADRGREVIAGRLRGAEARRERLLAAGRSLAAAARDLEDPLAALLDWESHQRELLGEEEPRGRRTLPEPGRPFRRYRLPGGWEVWVGRNNQENDELTHRVAAPEDLWFHAQGVPGSHVILRTGGRPAQVPHRVLEQAAALAALHSKARHSSLVPVIYTRRKYVRKPRKTPPGTATCLREKSLFVAPRIPKGATQE
jgi:predicted ribosome quality control (RQC) complex YloA/Tae2 family protein